MSHGEHSNGLYLRSSGIEGAAFGLIGIAGLVIAFVLVSFGQGLLAIVSGVAAVGPAALKLIGSSRSDDDSD